MKKIVILCASGIRNAGDEAILAALLDKFSSERYKRTVISLDPQYTEKIHGVKAVGFGDSECRPVIADCDLFIMGGGGLLQDETTIFNVGRWLWKLRLAIKLKKKTYLYANSIGPINYRLNSWFVKSILNKVDLISLRDELSKELLIRIGVDESRIKVTADPVFGLSDKEQAKFFVPQIKGLEKPYVLFCLRHWYDTHPLIPVRICTKYNLRSRANKDKYDRLVEELAKFIQYLNEERNLKVVFLSFCHKRDSLIANDVLARVNNERNLVVDELELIPYGTFGLIDKAQFVVGMRLHAIIFSILLRKKFLSLVYSEKVKGLLEVGGLSQLGLHVDQFKSSEAEQLVDEFMYGEQSDHIVQKIASFLDDSRQKEANNYLLGEKLLES